MTPQAALIGAAAWLCVPPVLWVLARRARARFPGNTPSPTVPRIETVPGRLSLPSCGGRSGEFHSVHAAEVDAQ